MIGQLKGLVDHLDTDQVLIDVQGVGYQVLCSSRTLATLMPGQSAVLKILTHVREDHIHLYGFLDDQEKAWFDIFVGVQGVGPKMALSILGQMGPSDLANALMLEDKRPFQAISGVGPKLAARLVTELKQKSPKLPSGVSVSAGETQVSPQVDLTGSAAVLQDLISALTNLGYDETQARSAATTALTDLGDEADLNALIPVALKALAR